MTDIQFVLGYGIVHVVCVIHIFNMMDYFKYKPDDFEKITVWVMAPAIILLIFIRTIFKGGKR